MELDQAGEGGGQDHVKMWSQTCHLGEVASTGSTGQSGYWLCVLALRAGARHLAFTSSPWKWPHPTHRSSLCKVKEFLTKIKLSCSSKFGHFGSRTRVPHPWAGHHQKPQAGRSDSTGTFSLCTWQVSASSCKAVCSGQRQNHLTSKHSVTDVNEDCIIFGVAQRVFLLPRKARHQSSSGEAQPSRSR